MGIVAKGSKVRVGAIGIGGIGGWHLKCLTKVPEVEVVAIADINKEANEQILKTYDVPNVFTDYKEMLKMKDLDAVVVGLPNFLHAPVTIAALEAGKHVLCEKPLADNVANGKKIVDAAAKAKKALFMIAYNNRFRGESQLLKKYIDDGALGEIYYAKCGWVRRTGIPGWGAWFTNMKLAGGGPMIDIGVHVMDLTMWLMGFPKAVSTYGSSYTKFGPRGIGMWGQLKEGDICDTEDLSAGMVKFDNDASLFVEASWAQNCEEEKIYVEVYGTEGGAKLDSGALTIFTRQYGNHVNLVTQPPKNEQVVEEWKHFVSCIQNKKKPMCTAEQGLQTLKIIDGIYRSAKTGASIKL